MQSDVTDFASFLSQSIRRQQNMVLTVGLPGFFMSIYIVRKKKKIQ